MLRTIFVLALIVVGAYYAVQGPFYALLFYIGNAYFRPEEWVWIELIKKINLSFLAGLLVLMMTLLRRQQFIMNGRIALVFLFLGHTFFSLLLSEHFAYSWPYWKDFCKAIVITYLIVVLVTDTTRFRLLLLVMALALGLEQAKQGWYYLVFPPDWGSGNPNPIAFLGDNNSVAVGMLMLVPVINFLMQTTQRKWVRRFYGVFLVGVLFRALTTYSRGGFLACLGMGGVYWLRSKQKLRFLLGIMVLMAIVIPALPTSFWDRINTIQTYEEDKSSTGRLHFWNVAIRMANANPVFGVGFIAYNPSYDTYDFSQGEYATGRSVHSSFFGILAELGYVGLLLYGAIFFSAFRSCQRVRKLAARNLIPSELGYGAAALEASLTAFLIGGFFLPFQYTEMLWHFIGLTIVLGHLKDQFIAQRKTEPWLEAARDASSSPALISTENTP
jgi:probable O-glycosylation ligase (exosortase A-associated)